MLKIFRKYNKVILVVGGTILMVIFLLPAGMSQMAQGRFAQPWAKIGGQRITIQDVQKAQREMRALNGAVPTLMRVLPIDADYPGEHWIMLTHEAEEAGLVGGVNDGASFIAEGARLTVETYIAQMAQQLGAATAQALFNQRDAMILDETARAEAAREQARQSLGLTSEEMDRALAKARGVFRMLRASDPTTVFSKPEAIDIGHQINDTATIGAAIFPASKISDGESDPNEEELLAHFEQYQDVRPADDENGIGYILPPAVRIEWIEFDHVAAAARVELDGIELNKYWRQNWNPEVTAYESVRAQVETRFRETKVEEMLGRLDQVMQQELFRSMSGLKGTSQKKTLPPDWSVRMPRRLDLVQVCQDTLSREFDLTEGDQIVTGSSAPTWNARQALSALPPSQSTFKFNAQTNVGFVDYVMNVQELDGIERLGVQTELFYGPLIDTIDSSHYFVRILEVRKEGSAGNLEEVRLQAIKDLKYLNAIETLEFQADTFRQEAVEKGLATFASNWDLDAEWNLSVTPIQTLRSDGSVHPEYNNEALRLAIIDQARQTDPTQPLAEADAPQRTVVMTVPEARGLVFAELAEWKPMTLESFRQSAILISGRARNVKNPGGVLGAFSFEAMSKRVAFEWLVDKPVGDSETVQVNAEDKDGT